MVLLIRVLLNMLKVSILKVKYKRDFKSHFILNYALNTEFHLLDKGAIELGSHVVIEKCCSFDAVDGGQLKIGQRVYFNKFCMVSCHNQIDIGDGCVFGPDVKVYDNNHIYTKAEGVSYKHTSAPIKIGKRCWIGANAVILKGTEIGDNCVIGAGCVVSGKVPAGSLVIQDRKLLIQPIQEKK